MSSAAPHYLFYFNLSLNHKIAFDHRCRFQETASGIVANGATSKVRSAKTKIRILVIPAARKKKFELTILVKRVS